MTLHWVDIAWVVAIVVAGCGAGYFLLLGKLQRTLANNQRETERRLAALTEAIKSRAAVSTESATDALAAAEIEAQSAAIPGLETTNAQVRAAGASTEPAPQIGQAIPLEIQVAIAAAAIAALGNHAHVRSARQVPSSDVVSPWTQQGRVIVQSSHNLRSPGSR